MATQCCLRMNSLFFIHVYTLFHFYSFVILTYDLNWLLIQIFDSIDHAGSIWGCYFYLLCFILTKTSLDRQTIMISSFIHHSLNIYTSSTTEHSLSILLKNKFQKSFHSNVCKLNLVFRSCLPFMNLLVEIFKLLIVCQNQYSSQKRSGLSKGYSSYDDHIHI